MLNKIKNLKKILLLFVVVFSISFSNEQAKENLESKQQNQEIASVNKEENNVEFFMVYDPWEGMNRRIYYFNYYFDTYVFQPVVNTYTFITPDILEEGVSNFYSNSKNVGVIVNSAAQGKVRKFMKSLGRFSINSVLGLFGVVDVATNLDMPSPYEDFGTTFAYYGIPSGPYVVLPVLGPSNLRNAVGTGINIVGTPRIHPYTLTDSIDMTNMGVSALDSIDARKNVKFRYYSMGTPFEYEYVRFMYSEYRKHLESVEQ